jgi:hypothetical protein
MREQERRGRPTADEVQYDWALSTLADLTAGTTQTILPQTCATNSSWVQVTASVTAGHTYELTLTSHDDDYGADPTYTLFDDVALSGSAPPPPSGIVNGGFETGAFAPWTPSGQATSIVTTAHSGTYAAMLGSTSETNGNSSIAQTFTAPSGSSTVAFSYAVNCTDNVFYDWATATLKDNTTGTTKTILGKTCPSSFAWTHASASITAGHSYTITLTNHDDGTFDPTYTLYDDVSTQ